MECKIEVFKANTRDGENIIVQQGDAVNLQNIASDHYDIILLLGPMYHFAITTLQYITLVPCEAVLVAESIMI